VSIVPGHYKFFSSETDLDFTQAHFAILRTLLAAGGNFLTIQHEISSENLTVRVDRTKIGSHGRPALSELLLKLHIYRCTADVGACREFYEALTKPDETFLQWRQIMLKRQPAKQVFVQPNTMIVDGRVVIKEYEASVEGMIQSWAERMDML
jgi:dipeptidyl-peptidase III